MSVRIQPLRVLLGQRSLHTSSCVLHPESSTPAAKPKPQSFTDLGFGTSNANRTRDLPRLDLGSIGGDIGVKSSTDRAPQAPRADRSNQPRPRNDRPRQNNGPRTPRPAASTAAADSSANTDFFEHSKESEVPARQSAVAGGRRKQAAVDMSLIDMDANITSQPPRGPRQTDRPPREPRASGQSDRPRGDRGENQRSQSTNRFGGSGGPGGPGGLRRSGPGASVAGPGGARAPGGTGGAAGAARKGGRRKRGDNDRPEKNDDAALRAIRQQWEGALVLPQEVETTDKVLFGAPSLLSKTQLLALTKNQPKLFAAHKTDLTNYRSTTVRLPQNRPARSLSNVGTKEQNVLRLVGDMSYRLPTLPVPSDPKLQKDKKAFMKSTFEWQMALQQNLAPAHQKQIKAASAILSKVLA